MCIVCRAGHALFWVFLLALLHSLTEPFALFFGSKILRFCIRTPSFLHSYFSATCFSQLYFRAPSFLLCSRVYIYTTTLADRTGRIGQAEQDTQNETGRTGQAEQDRQKGKGRTGPAERTGRTGKAELNTPNGTHKMG